jgi:hypothetical protein
MTLNEEIVLICAMRYALGRRTYVVGSVCSELKKHYNEFSITSRKKIVKKIEDYQNEYGIIGSKIDDIEWNKIKWLFDDSNKVIIKAKYYNIDKWEKVIAIKAPDGKYYSIPDVVEYQTAIEIDK